MYRGSLCFGRVLLLILLQTIFHGHLDEGFGVVAQGHVAVAIAAFTETAIEGDIDACAKIEGDVLGGLNIGKEAKSLGDLGVHSFFRKAYGLGTEVENVAFEFHTQGILDGGRCLIVEVVVCLHKIDAPAVVEFVGIDEHWVEGP